MPLKGHTSTVAGVVVTPDGNRIVTASSDGTIRIWDANSGVELVRLQSNIGNVYGLGLTADGSRLVTGAGATGVRIWEMPPSGQALVGEARKIARRCLTPAQRLDNYLPVRPPEWCGSMEKWPYDSISAVIEGPKLIGEGKEDEGEAVLAHVAKDPAVAKHVDEARAIAYLSRGTRMMDSGLEEQASDIFAKAVKHDPSAAKRISEVLVEKYVGLGKDLAEQGKDRGG